MQKQIKKNQTKRQQQKLAVIMALVNGLNMAAPMALAATDVFPVPVVDSSRQMASALTNQGVRVLDHLFFSTAHAATTIDSSYDGGNGTQDVTTNDSELYIIENGGTQNVFNSGTVTSATVNNGGAQNVLRGGTASSTVVSGGTMDIVAGSATRTSLVAGDMTVWGSGGTATVTDTIISGGTMAVKENGKAVATIVSGGTVSVSGYYNDYNKTTTYGTLENTTVYNGGWVDVGKYGVASGTTISGGTMKVSSAGTATSTTISGGGDMNVSSGGTASATTISGGGYMKVFSGGTASATTVNGGYMYVNSGTVTGTVVSDGEMRVSSGTVSGTQVSGGEMLVSGGAVTDVTIAGRQEDGAYSYGNMTISNGATVEDITVNDGGFVHADNGTARTVTVNSGGTAQVYSSNGSINGATVSAGGILSLRSSGSAENISLNDGYILMADTSARLVVLPVAGAVPSIANGVASNLVLNNGGYLAVLNGHSASDTIVNSGGGLYISGGGAADDTVVNGGAVLLGDQALLDGVTLNKGAIGLALGANSASITELAVSSGGTVDLTYNTYFQDDWDMTTTGRSLTIDSLNGNASFVINTDLANNKADHITISSGVGNHTLAVAYDPLYDSISESTTQPYAAEFAAVQSGTAGFAAVSTEYGGYRFLPTLESVDAADASSPVKWMVTGFAVDGSGPGPVPGASTLAYNAAGTAAGGVSLWRQENNSLTRRLGELRNGGQGGDWARIYKGKLEADSFGRKVKQQYTAIQGGHDTLVRYQGRDWYAGYALGYLDSSASMERGGGDASSLTAGAYAAWLGDKGHYLDFIVKAGRLKNDYYSYDAGNQKISGDYHTWGTSVSAEYGYRKQLPGSWYVEPQAELTLGRVGSADYTLSDSTRVSQDGMTSLVGRLGIAAGRIIGNTHFYAKTSLMREFTADTRITLKTGGLSQTMEEDLKDSWLELVVGVTGSFNERVNGYLELSRTTGGDKAKTPWQVNLGARWNF